MVTVARWNTIELIKYTEYVLIRKSVCEKLPLQYNSEFSNDINILALGSRPIQ